jgi:hypothetical protein
MTYFFKLFPITCSGLDSAMFAYLKRNWTWNSKAYAKRALSSSVPAISGDAG